MRIYLKGLAATLMMIGVIGCSALPKSGPASRTISASADAQLTSTSRSSNFSYAFVDITRQVIEKVPESGPSSLNRTFGFGMGAPLATLVGPGDTVQVTIFEAAPGGLFIPSDAGARPGNYVQLPATSVDSAGVIYVPYAGRVDVVGKTVLEIGERIEEKLAKRAIEPKVLVTLLSQRASDISIVGEVNAPSKLAISVGGDRVLDVLAKAGGTKNPGYETYVTLLRGRKQASVFFDDIVANDEENIYVRPSDLIYVYKQARSFIVLGASGQSGRFDFENAKLYLSEAVARAGGLNDGRADPRSVFIYRMERRSTLVGMGANLTSFPPDVDQIPTVYRANFSDPASFFAAQKFAMRDKDIIYVSNAGGVEVAKFLSLVTATTGAVSGISLSVTDTKAAVDVFSPPQ